MITSKNHCWLAKKIALSIEGMIAKQYRRLYDYGVDITRSNPGSTIKIGVKRNDENGLTKFQRMYICFAGLNFRFKEGYMKVIGLNG